MSKQIVAKLKFNYYRHLKQSVLFVCLLLAACLTARAQTDCALAKDIAINKCFGTCTDPETFSECVLGCGVANAENLQQCETSCFNNAICLKSCRSTVFAIQRGCASPQTCPTPAASRTSAGPAAASANFTSSDRTLDVKLNNALPNPRSAGQLLSEIAFRLSNFLGLGWRAPAAASDALATTIVVNSTADGTLAALAMNTTCDLREAIEAANTNTAVGQCPAGMAGPAMVDTITFAPGVTGTITLMAGELAITEALTITGPGAQRLTISGNNASRIFSIGAGAGDVTLSELTIANGRGGVSRVEGPGAYYNIAKGGGILNNSTGTLTIHNSVITGNTASASGGSGNIGGGGGIFNSGSGTVTVTNSVITGNSASASGGNDNIGYGGGIYNFSGTVNVTNSTLTGNTALASDGGSNISYGGGIYNFSGTVNVTNSTLTGNTASASGGIGNIGVGGGIYNSRSGTENVTSGTLIVTNSTLTGNTASASGGGSSNQVLGGGIYNSGTVTVTNSTLTRNTASASVSMGDGEDIGGGNGGGIFNFGMASVRSTIIAENSATTSGPDVSGTFTSSGYNLIGNGCGSTSFTQPTDKVGTAEMPINPLLAPLGFNGGPTPTHELLPGSPAINAGDNCVLTAGGCGTNNPPTALTTDQRGAGFPRNLGGTVDIGAFEVNYALRATSGTPQSTTVNTAFSAALQVTVKDVFDKAVSGVQVTFTAPASGASASFPNGNTAITNASGQASVNVTANNITGSYQVTANTTPGLATAASFNLSNLCAAITITSVPTVNPTCNGAANGGLTIQATGGISPLMYSINNGQTFTGSNQFTGLTAGTYQVVVKDANSCSSATSTVMLTQPAALTAMLSGSTIIRPGQAATLSVTLTGGSAPYSITLSNGGGTKSGASPLQFTVTPTTTTAYTISSAKDNNNCTATLQGSATVTVDGAPPTVTCPSSQVGVVTSGSVAVNYPQPTVSDNNPGAGVNCSPLSGNPFPLGTTTVNCMATDVAGNIATCNFTVVVRTPRAAVNNLKTQVQALVPGTLAQAQANQMLSYLELASTHLEQGNNSATCTDLANFNTMCNQRTPPMNTTQRDNLVIYANKIRIAIGCGSSFGAQTGGLYNRRSGEFYLKQRLTTGLPDQVERYGGAGDLPVVGDWDGDGITTIGLYGVGGEFLLRNTNAAGTLDLVFTLGVRGGLPVAGRWGDTRRIGAVRRA